MPTLTANNIDIYYKQEGEGPDVVLIGGLSADHNVWKSSLRLFKNHFRVTTFDSRGAGQTTTSEGPYTSTLMAQDTLALMEKLNIPKAHIVGHSMGGCIAQQIAIHHPEKCDKLVLTCSREKPNALANMVLSMKEKLETAGVDKQLLAEYVMPFLFSESFLQNETQIKGFVQWTLQNPYPQTALGYANQLAAVRTHDVSQEISKIRAKTLVIAGEEDCLMPAKNAKEVAAQIPNAQFVCMPGCAHMPHVEKSREFAELVLDFLQING